MTLSSKGQITIPLTVRTRLGLHPGDRVEFVMIGGQTVLRPVREENDNPFKNDIGILPAFKNVGEINAWVAGMRDED
jgi:antitoxin PrlF